MIKSYIQSKNKKFNFISYKNINSKPTAFAIDSQFDPSNNYLISDDDYKVLRLGLVVPSAIVKFFTQFEKHFGIGYQKGFWFVRGKNQEIFGIGIKNMYKLLKTFRHNTFVYYLMNYECFITLIKTKEIGSPKLIIYINNSNFPYIDTINFFKTKFKEYKSNFKIITKSVIDVNYERCEPYIAFKSNLKYHINYKNKSLDVPHHFIISKASKKTQSILDNIEFWFPFRPNFDVNTGTKIRAQVDILNLPELDLISLNVYRVEKKYFGL